MIIQGKEIQLKNKLRSILLYEQIADKTFSPTTITDMMLYFYCVVISCNDLNLTFAEFLDILDEDPTLFTEFNKWLVSINDINSQYGDTELKKNPQ